MFMKTLRSKIIFIILAATTASSFLFCSEYFRRNEPRGKAEQAELWNALETGNVNFAVELLRTGANPNTRGRDYLTVLEYAAHKGYKEVVEELLNSEIPLGQNRNFQHLTRP